MKVLIVDDSAAVRTKLARFVRELGHEVVGEAANGFEAIEQYQHFKPDLVTMDIVMPECDGLTALSEILKLNPNAKVAMITSAATVANRYEARDKGAIGFVVKPFEKNKVANLFQEIEKMAA